MNNETHEKYPNVEARVINTQDANEALRDLRDSVPLGSVDVIVDDGLHTWEGQQRTVVSLWPFLRYGGYYFIEDVQWDNSTHENGHPFASTSGVGHTLVTYEPAKTIFARSHPIALAVGAFHNQAKFPGSMILLTKKPTGDPAVDDWAARPLPSMVVRPPRA